MSAGGVAAGEGRSATLTVAGSVFATPVLASRVTPPWTLPLAGVGPSSATGALFLMFEVTTKATITMMATTAATMPQPISSLLRLSFFSCASRISRAFSRAAAVRSALDCRGSFAGLIGSSGRAARDGPLSGNFIILGEKPENLRFQVSLQPAQRTNSPEDSVRLGLTESHERPQGGTNGSNGPRRPRRTRDH